MQITFATRETFFRLRLQELGSLWKKQALDLFTWSKLQRGASNLRNFERSFYHVLGAGKVYSTDRMSIEKESDYLAYVNPTTAQP